MIKKYFGIKTPKTTHNESYIWWISDDADKSWRMFFTQPNKQDRYTHYRPTISEAIKAYTMLGYKCVELDIKEICEYNFDESDEESYE